MAYVTVCPICGAWCDWTRDTPGDGAVTMTQVRTWLAARWTVKRVSYMEAKVGVQRCLCSQPQAAQQLDLFNK